MQCVIRKKKLNLQTFCKNCTENHLSIKIIQMRPIIIGIYNWQNCKAAIKMSLVNRICARSRSKIKIVSIKNILVSKYFNDFKFLSVSFFGPSWQPWSNMDLLLFTELNIQAQASCIGFYHSFFNIIFAISSINHIHRMIVNNYYCQDIEKGNILSIQ